MSAVPDGTILISGARAPVALGIGRAFRAAGLEVHFVDSVDSWMTRWSSFGSARLHRVRPPRTEFAAFRSDIGALIAALDPYLIIPTCEEVFYLSRAAELDGFTNRLFAPSLDLLRRLHSKAQFAALAKQCGLDAPQTWLVRSTEELRPFLAQSRELVFKPEFSRFGTRALVRPERAEAAKLKAGPGSAWAVQEFIEGDEVSFWSAARNGQLLALAAYRPKWHFGGAGSYFLRDDDPELVEVCRRLVGSVGMTGQLSLDLIRTPEGRLRPIECNPRTVSGVQLFSGDARLAHALSGAEPSLLKPQVVACHVGPAFWPAAAARAASGGLPDAVRDARRSSDVLTQDGGARVVLGALLDFARFAVGGLRASRSSIEQSTADIEWNGEPIR